MSTPALTVVEFYRSLRSLGFRFEETATEGTIVRGLRHITNRAFWAEARMLPAKYALAEYQAWCKSRGIPCDDTLDEFCSWLRRAGFAVEPDERGVMVAYGMRLSHPEEIEFEKEDLEKFAEMQRLGIWPPNMPPMAA